MYVCIYFCATHQNMKIVVDGTFSMEPDGHISISAEHFKRGLVAESKSLCVIIIKERSYI